MTLPTPARRTAELESSPRSNGWGALVVLVALGALALAVWFISLPPPAPTSSALAAYNPLTNGMTLNYKVTTSDGQTTYRSVNAQRLQAGRVYDVLDLDTISALISALGIDLKTVSDNEAVDRLTRAPLFTVSAVETNAKGQSKDSTELVLAQPNAISLVKLDNLRFAPPYSGFNSTLELNVPQTFSSTLNAQALYPYTVTLQAREPISTPLGILNDCARVHVESQLLDTRGEETSWYCRGVGIARQEVRLDANGKITDTHYELTGAVTPGLVKTIPPPLPTAPTNATLHRVFDAPLGGTLTKRWEYADSYTSNAISTSPLATADLLYFGSQSGALTALDRLTQTVRWRYQTGNAIFGDPVIANGILYIGSGDKNFYALNAANGALLWAFPTRDAITASASVANGLVYFPSEDGTLYALDAATGAEQWRFQAGGAIGTQPLVANGRVVFGSDDGAVYALDATTGETRWAYATDDGISAELAIAGNIVYAGSNDDHLYALALDTTNPEGALQWKFDIVADITEGPTVANGRVYLNAGYGITALDAASGEVLWRYRTPRALYGSPLVFGNQVLVAGGHELIRLRAEDGRELDVTPVSDSTISATPGTDGTEIWVPLYSAHLIALGGGTP